jgi:hypothetical protein
METYYLVDFENVGSGGLSKCSGLNKTDHLVIFYTTNTKNIELDVINNHGAASFETKKVPAKSQSVDMHIVSYMGYLIGKYEGNSIKIVIISKDKDYDNLIKFWTGKAVSIERKQKIETSTPKKPQEGMNKQKSSSMKSDASQKASSAKTTTIKTVKVSPAKVSTKPEKKTQLNSEIQKILSKNDYKNEAIKEIAKIVGDRFGKENFKQEVHNELRRVYVNYKEVYELIRPLLEKFTKD